MQELRITGGYLRSRKITFHSADTLRPTLSKAREAVFNVLNGYLDFQSSSFLDMFAGSGIMSFEAISRGFEKVFAIEQNPKTAQKIKENAKILSVGLTLVNGKVPSILGSTMLSGVKYSVIYIDPPYQADLYEKTIETVIKKEILANDGVLVLESDHQIENLPNTLYIDKQKVYSGKFFSFVKKCKEN